MTVKERAQKIIDDERITLVPKQRVWALFKGNQRRAKCSCPATINCCHILDALWSIDCSPAPIKRVVPVLRMNKNAVKAAEKKISGRKRPLPHHVEPNKRRKMVDESLSVLQKEMLEEEEMTDMDLQSQSATSFHDHIDVKDVRADRTGGPEPPDDLVEIKYLNICIKGKN